MTPGSGRRLLLVPVLLFGVLVAVLQVLDGAFVQAKVDPSLDVAVEAPAAETEARRCARDGDPQAVIDVRRSLSTQPRVTSAMVVACPAAYDGVEVRYAGELVGDLLRRDGGAWVLVNDDGYALEVGPLPAHGSYRGPNSGLSVWLPDPLLDEVTGLGRPNQRGDVVDIRGRIARADPADGGGLTLRANAIDRLAPTVILDEPLDMPQLWFAVVVTTIAAGLWAFRRRAERS